MNTTNDSKEESGTLKKAKVVFDALKHHCIHRCQYPKCNYYGTTDRSCSMILCPVILFHRDLLEY